MFRASRRVFLAGGISGGAALLTAACASQPASPTAAPAANPTKSAAASATTGPAQQASATNGQPVQLQVWTGWTEQAAKNIESILALYNKSQNKYVAKHVIVSSNMLQKLLAAVAAGSPPDVAVVFGSQNVYQMAAEGGVLAMEDVADPQQLGEMKKWYSPNVWGLGTYQGKQYALPMWTQSYGALYNTTQLKAANIDPSKAPQTLDELDSYGDKLTQKSGGAITRLGFDLTFPELTIAIFHGTLMSSDQTKVTANDPKNVQALEWTIARYKKYGPQSVQNFYSSLQSASGRSAALDPFIAGKESIVIDGPWRIGSTQEFAPKGFEFGVWQIPGPSSNEKAGIYTYGDDFIIPKGAKDKQASWNIITYLTGEANDRALYTKLFVVWPCVNAPVSEQLLTDPTFKSQVINKCNGYTVYMNYLFKNQYVLYPPKTPTAASYLSLLESEWQKAYLGEKSAQQALDHVTQQAQSELDSWRKVTGQ